MGNTLRCHVPQIDHWQQSILNYLGQLQDLGNRVRPFCSMHHVNFKAQDLDLLQHLWDKGRTPVKIDILKLEPENYDNRKEATYLLSGFIEGFRLHYSGPRISTFSDNLISAQTHISETKEKLLKET